MYRSYTYTIPSFSSISLKLRHVKIISEDHGGGEVINDVFFNEEVQLVCPDLLPKRVKITKGCLVDVSLSRFLYI